MFTDGQLALLVSSLVVVAALFLLFVHRIVKAHEKREARLSEVALARLDKAEDARRADDAIFREEIRRLTERAQKYAGAVARIYGPLEKDLGELKRAREEHDRRLRALERLG